MSSSFTISLLAASVFFTACQKQSDKASPAPAPTTSSADELRTMGANHEQQGCPNLNGIYIPTKGTGSYFLFEKIDGTLFMKSRRQDGSEFQGSVHVNGKTFYSGAESATARCNGGKILVDLSHPTEPQKTALFKGGPQTMTRIFFQDGKEPQTTEYTQMIQ